MERCSLGVHLNGKHNGLSLTNDGIFLVSIVLWCSTQTKDVDICFVAKSGTTKKLELDLGDFEHSYTITQPFISKH